MKLIKGMTFVFLLTAAFVCISGHRAFAQDAPEKNGYVIAEYEVTADSGIKYHLRTASKVDDEALGQQMVAELIKSAPGKVQCTNAYYDSGEEIDAALAPVLGKKPAQEIYIHYTDAKDNLSVMDFFDVPAEVIQKFAKDMTKWLYDSGAGDVDIIYPLTSNAGGITPGQERIANEEKPQEGMPAPVAITKNIMAPAAAPAVVAPAPVPAAQKTVTPVMPPQVLPPAPIAAAPKVEVSAAVVPAEKPKYFSRAATKEEVRSIQGEPTKIVGHVWLYGSDYVEFGDNGTIVEYSNILGTLKIEPEKKAGRKTVQG
ncbi:MAG: hypothetical protein HQL28_03070 [Candidatus Omnitrophica bacterium]|nr:hypothetical protein [Candidatus Omnitrophota bacterium]